MKKKFIFYFPVKEIGGIHFLILRILKQSNLYGNNECIVIDKEDGSVFEILDSNLVKYEKVNCTKDTWKNIANQYDISNYTLIFMSGGNFYDLFKDIKLEVPKLKVLFYLVHPETFLNFYANTMIDRLSFGVYNLRKFYINNTYKRLTSMVLDFVNDVNKNDSLVFMDEENVSYSEKLFNVNIEPSKMLPIPIDNISNPIWNRGTELNIGWLGRLEKSKANVLHRILRDYKMYIEKNKLSNTKFVIIGDGDGKLLLEQEVKKLDIESYVVFKGTILKEKLVNEISKFSILFGMGTSVLEGAALGVPSVLVDWYKFLPQKVNYRWVYETKNYTLGKVIEKGTELELEQCECFGDIIDQYYNFDDVGNKCYEYAQEHEIKNVYNKLVQLSNECKFTFEKFNVEKMHKYYYDLLPVKITRLIKNCSKE